MLKMPLKCFVLYLLNKVKSYINYKLLTFWRATVEFSTKALTRSVPRFASVYLARSRFGLLLLTLLNPILLKKQKHVLRFRTSCFDFTV